MIHVVTIVIKRFECADLNILLMIIDYQIPGKPISFQLKDFFSKEIMGDSRHHRYSENKPLPLIAYGNKATNFGQGYTGMETD